MSRLPAIFLALALSTVGLLVQNAPSGEHWGGAWNTALIGRSSSGLMTAASRLTGQR
jgi:hypothetical protein